MTTFSPPLPRTPPEPPDAAPTLTTIAVLGDSLDRQGEADVVARLAELALTDELVVVYRLDERDSGPGMYSVTERLRGLLPRHFIVAVYVEPCHRFLGRGAALADVEAAVLDDVLDDGGLPIVATPAWAIPAVVDELCRRLRADRVLRMSFTPRGGSVVAPARRARACHAA